MPTDLHLFETEVLLEVPFHDLDPVGIVWHGNYVRYIELARCALLEKLGYNYDAMGQSGYAFPVIDLQLRYVQAARFKQKLRVLAWIADYEYRLKLGYRIEDALTGQRLTKGHSVQAAVELASGELCLASPAILLEKIQAFL